MSYNTCTICFDEINLYDSILIGNCGHMYCNNCWSDFIKNHKITHGSIPPKCPSCKSIIHIPSITHTSRIIEPFQKKILDENLYLRNLLNTIVNLNRAETGKWKYQYKNKLILLKDICDNEYNNRQEIEKEFWNFMADYRISYSLFLKKLYKLRKQMKYMTKNYKPLIRQSSIPQDPIHSIPAETIVSPIHDYSRFELRLASNHSSNIRNSSAVIDSFLSALTDGSTNTTT